MTPHPPSFEQRADEIVQEMIDKEAWRDNLHLNDLPLLRALTTSALRQVDQAARKEERERWKKAIISNCKICEGKGYQLCGGRSGGGIPAPISRTDCIGCCPVISAAIRNQGQPNEKEGKT